MKRIVKPGGKNTESKRGKYVRIVEAKNIIGNRTGKNMNVDAANTGRASNPIR
jgi:hypothetical protein